MFFVVNLHKNTYSTPMPHAFLARSPVWFSSYSLDTHFVYSFQTFSYPVSPPAPPFTTLLLRTVSITHYLLLGTFKNTMTTRVRQAFTWLIKFTRGSFRTVDASLKTWLKIYKHENQHCSQWSWDQINRSLAPDKEVHFPLLQSEIIKYYRNKYIFYKLDTLNSPRYSMFNRKLKFIEYTQVTSDTENWKCYLHWTD